MARSHESQQLEIDGLDNGNNGYGSPDGRASNPSLHLERHRELDSVPLLNPTDAVLALMASMPLEDQESFLNRIHDEWCVLCGKSSKAENPLFACYCPGKR